MLVKRVGEFLADLLEVLAERVRLYDERVPFGVQDREDAGNGGRRKRTRVASSIN